MTAPIGFFITAGHDNAGDLNKLNELGDGIFLAYDVDVNTLWHSEQSFRMDGDGLNHRVGLEWAVVKFQGIRQLEAKAVDDLVGPVTVNLRRKHRAEWITFNGILQPVAWGNYDQWSGSFMNVELELTELEELT